MSICAQVRKILTGAYNEGDPPLSIPNREVKPLRADGTAAMWESRSALDLGSPAGSKPRDFFLFFILDFVILQTTFKENRYVYLF